MSVKIKEGAYYITNEGLVAGPAEKEDYSSTFCWNVPNIRDNHPCYHAYKNDGSSILADEKYNLSKEIEVDEDKNSIIQFKDLKKEEKKDILFAHYVDNKKIEYYYDGFWRDTEVPGFYGESVYRVKEEQSEVKTFSLCLKPEKELSLHMRKDMGIYPTNEDLLYATLEVKFTDGVPDWKTASIKGA